MSADGRPGDAGRGGLDEELHAWVLAVTGATAVRAEQRPGGASRVGWALDVSHPDGRVEALWLRTDRPEAQREEGADSLRREAAVYRALAPTEVRVPAVVAVHPTREAFVMERVEGRTWFSELRDDEAREAVARDFTSQLAALHRLRPASLDLPALGPVRSIHELVTEELDGAFARARAAAEPPEPLLCLALRWLRRTVPDDGDVPVVLVQGDTGPGNFMYAEERVVAVLDWELAHWGDPHDDLAWLYLRDLQERFTSMPRRLAQYAAESGVPVDLERLRWFRVLAELRCAGGIMGTLASAQPSAEFPNLLIYGVLHLRALAEDLAVRTGVQRGDPFVPDAAPTERTRLFDLGIGDLRTTIGPRVDDALAKRRTSGLARLLKYLRELDRLGPAVAAAEREELGALLGRRVDDDVEGRRALAHGILAGEHDDAEVARYGLGRADRLTAVCHDAMGALADRHFSPLALGEPPRPDGPEHGGR